MTAELPAIIILQIKIESNALMLHQILFNNTWKSGGTLTRTVCIKLLLSSLLSHMFISSWCTDKSSIKSYQFVIVSF